MTPAGFIDRYRKAWTGVMTGARDASDLAPFFDLPCVMILADGAAQIVTDLQGLDAFNAQQAKAFSREDAGTTSLDDIEVADPGGHTAFVSVRWHLHRRDGSLARVWRDAYTLRRVENDWRIIVSEVRSRR